MKLIVVLLAATTALSSAQSCQNVSVVGDGTYCITGPVCSGTPSNKGGDKCPQVGDTAVSDCFPTNPAFNKATGKCTAPVPADCKPLPSGAWGCVWDLSKLPGGGSQAPTPTTVTPIQNPGQQTLTPATPEPTKGKDCTEVTVVGDGAFCIKGPVCGGLAANKGGDQCPQVGDVAFAACGPFNPSYNKETGKCVAPVPANCIPTNGVWACNWDFTKLPKA
jgi:hypothetical protein